MRWYPEHLSVKSKACSDEEYRLGMCDDSGRLPMQLFTDEKRENDITLSLCPLGDAITSYPVEA